MSRPVPLQYAAAPVTPGPVVRSVTATGTVNPVLTIIVGTYVSGVIQETYCDYNTKVTKGQLCAKIDPPYQAVVDQDRAKYVLAFRGHNLCCCRRARLQQQVAIVHRDDDIEGDNVLGRLRRLPDLRHNPFEPMFRKSLDGERGGTSVAYA
jgi:multidrug efflux pump subunit AcrA (membrane-fusion protein)